MATVSVRSANRLLREAGVPMADTRREGFKVDRIGREAVQAYWRGISRVFVKAYVREDLNRHPEHANRAQQALAQIDGVMRPFRSGWDIYTHRLIAECEAAALREAAALPDDAGAAGGGTGG